MLGKRKRPFVSAIIVAAGSATRMEGVDKQLAEIGGVPVVIRSMLAFERTRLVDEIIVVTRAESLPELHRQVCAFACEKVKTIVAGGKTRQESVFSGIACVDERCQYVAIHDGARPMVHPEAIESCLADAMQYGAALLAVPIRDTLKRVGPEQLVEQTIRRDHLFAAQTPQIFEMELYRRAMRQAQADGADYTDDCQLVEAVGQRVYASAGQESNLKITTPEDLIYAQLLLAQEMGDI